PALALAVFLAHNDDALLDRDAAVGGFRLAFEILLGAPIVPAGEVLAVEQRGEPFFRLEVLVGPPARRDQGRKERQGQHHPPHGGHDTLHRTIPPFRGRFTPATSLPLAAAPRRRYAAASSGSFFARLLQSAARHGRTPTAPRPSCRADARPGPRRTRSASMP